MASGGYEFRLEHIGSIKNHMMSGMTVSQWLRLLWSFRGDIEWLRFWYRIAFLTFLSIVNSILAIPDALFFSSAIRKQRIRDDPVFILGHPRTGTTHLHNLMSLDSKQFTFCNTFEVGFPSSFLSCEAIGKRLLSGMVDSTRPMDNMALSMDTPSEDEIATNTMSSGLCSPYMALVLPNRYRDTFSRCFDFSNAPSELFNEWQKQFTHFLKKLSIKSEQECPGGGKRLLLKSPVHAGRVALLKKMFPKAKFIYIHRNPYEVFRSATNMADKYYGYCCLTTPKNDDLLHFVLHQYKVLFENYVRDREQLSSEDYVEVSFAELESKPIDTLRSIYDGLNLEGKLDEARIAEYCASLGDFKKNHHRPMPAEMKAVIDDHWGPSFSVLGYSQELPPSLSQDS